MIQERAATDVLLNLDGRQTWRWPSRETWFAFVRYAIAIQLLWALVYGGCSWLTAHRAHRVQLASPWDSKIPFMPSAAAVYLSLGPMLWLSPFFLRSISALRRFAEALAWLIIISGIGFLLLPADEPAIPNHANTLMNFADCVNLDHNLCPSLHVAMAVITAAAYTRRGNPLKTAFFLTWAAAIGASTLLTRGHFIIDAVAGAILGYLLAHFFVTAER